MTAPLTVLVVGATGSIGSLAVAESLAAGHRTRALAATGPRRTASYRTRPMLSSAMSPDPRHSLPRSTVWTRSC